jgi:hypothetical protein
LIVFIGRYSRWAERRAESNALITRRHARVRYDQVVHGIERRTQHCWPPWV